MCEQKVAIAKISKPMLVRRAHFCFLNIGFEIKRKKKRKENTRMEIGNFTFCFEQKNKIMKGKKSLIEFHV